MVTLWILWVLVGMPRIMIGKGLNKQRNVVLWEKSLPSKIVKKTWLPKNCPHSLISTNTSMHKFTFKKLRKGVEIINNVLHSSRNNFIDEDKQDSLG